MKKTTYFILIILILLGVTFGVVALRNGEEDSSFTLSVNSWVGFAPFWLAQEKGFYEDEGVIVKIVTIDDTAQRKAAMIRGSIDGLGDTVDLLVLSRAQEVPSVAVMQIDVSNGADGILVTENINSVSDLEGQTVAVQKNFVGEAFLNYILEKNNMSPNDVRTVDTESGAAGAAFVSGNVDVAVTYEPWLSKAKERSGGKVLISSADEPGVIVDILSINEEYLASNKETVSGVMRAWFRAIEYWKENPDEANALMARYYDVSVEEFEELISGLVWPTYEENLTYFDEEVGKIYEVANIFLDVFKNTGQVESAPAIERAVDNSLLVNLYEK